MFRQLQEHQASQEPILAYLEQVDHIPEQMIFRWRETGGCLTQHSEGNNIRALEGSPGLQKPQEKPFQDLVAPLKMHYESKPMVIEQQFNFHCRDQNRWSK